MDDFILRETAIKIVKNAESRHDALFALRTIPSLAIVRCKDCVHCHSLTEYPLQSVFYSCAIWGRSDLSGNCYCAYGESREAALAERREVDDG